MGVSGQGPPALSAHLELPVQSGMDSAEPIEATVIVAAVI